FHVTGVQTCALPIFLVVNPALKTIGILSLGMPLPVSETSIKTLPSLPRRIFIAMVPVLPMASTAFLQRFSITHSNNGTCTQAVMWSERVYTSMFIFEDTRGRR